MKRNIITTGDGSKTIQITDWNEQYHSTHGAIQEAYHVFIKMGFTHHTSMDLQILEMGFGTGLNALITLKETLPTQRQVQYTTLEAYPVGEAEWSQLNYVEQLKDPGLKPYYEALHKAEWEKLVSIEENFLLHKKKMPFEQLSDVGLYDLVYYDAFGARVQPELWDVACFERVSRAMRSGGVLVTYAAKGSVRRAMQEVGLMVERLPGPPGKREMLRATKS
ncbi:tRNA (5-methylaminomethyl-2-thiouridine)(34)-methyltransferase MnmD [Zeaxanthinibacter sp. PT1]|uniref:tRNA (5-methylaminomethyl-2-thiouridine)(34)-methyltransferase MnmD n=1 Tax=Zeaxanthinibacter TaxID=561554 RepID=UPI00234A8E12|nr:tRNA (5-methylaminomethyl-2-thiouridine)(34)-methyltransferase MnmD [Zeaxanthinibacter sp. PT1]MDC6352478.1 tRNA (5-methylaminomethyl-2-thiouridine)(34)-methyltransferase MnmD [Zeaxanthinibacter sp. PT1]